VTMTDAAAWQRVKALLVQTLELEESARAAFVESACAGDVALREELESLLLAERGDQLDPLPPSLALEAVQARTGRAWIGRRLGPWRVLSLIASGGMGEVYRAERVDGQFEQQVAVKAMHEGNNPVGLVARFKAERQILASLDHPNLAKVLDGGITEDGTPYFVMELVDGEPIDVHCERQQLPLERRLQLFRTVCQVVHYAHQKHVVHRDLKVDNILVTRDGVVKLVDFGIAKRLDAGAPDEPTRTATAQRMMTLVYSSPEQVRGQDITPASDVYSLGVVLYRLLTQATPYPGTTATSAYDLTRAICDTEPLPPSQAATVQLQGTRRRLRGDLDAVVMMALRKDPAHRYASAEAMSEDLFRHLEGLPVQARRGAWSYRTGRFVLRHRAVVGGVMVANLALVAGIAAAGYEAWQANQQRMRAERNSATVRRLADTLIFDVHDAIRDLPGATQARKLVIERGLDSLQKQQSDFAGDPSLLVDIGTGYRKIGEIQGRANMASLGDLAAARASYAKAREILLRAKRELPAADPHQRQATLELIQVDEFEAAALVAAGRLKEAAALLQSARERSAVLVAANPNDPYNDFRLGLQYSNHSSLLRSAGDLAGYTEASNRALQLLAAMHERMPKDTDVTWALASTLNERGVALMEASASADAGRQAGDVLARSIALWEQLHAAQPDNAFFRRNVASGRNNLGEALILAARYGDAAHELQQSIDISESLAKADPADLQVRVYRSVAQINLSRASLGQGRRESAHKLAQQALQALSALPEAAVSDPNVRAYHALGWHALAQASAAGTPAACGAERSALELLLPLQKTPGIPPGALQPETVRAALARCSRA